MNLKKPKKTQKETKQKKPHPQLPQLRKTFYLHSYYYLLYYDAENENIESTDYLQKQEK